MKTNISQVTLDALRREAEKAGRDGVVLVDSELVLELLDLATSAEDTPDAKELWTGGYEAGWEECAEDIVPICSPKRAEQAWDRLRKP